MSNFAENIATAVCRTVAELPDRNSPEDWPEAMLVTADELRSIVLAALSANADEAEQQVLSDEQLDALDTFSLACMAPRGKASVRAYARAVIASAAPKISQPSASESDDLAIFLNACAGEGLVMQGVDAADLYVRRYGEHPPAAVHGQSASTEGADERWIIARETVINDVPDSRPTLGYTVFAEDFTSFASFDEASAAIHELKLPLGWCAMRTTQSPWPSLFATPPAAIPAAPSEDVMKSLEAIEIFAKFIQRTLDHEDFTAAKVPGLKDGLLYSACERAMFIQNSVKSLRAALAQPAPVQQEAAGDAQYQAWEENATLARLPVRSDANAATDCAHCNGVGTDGDHNGERYVEVPCEHCNGTGRAALQPTQDAKVGDAQ